MISYKPFYETLYKKGVTEYHLIFKQGFSANTLHRIKKGEVLFEVVFDTPLPTLPSKKSNLSEKADSEVEV